MWSPEGKDQQGTNRDPRPTVGPPTDLLIGRGELNLSVDAARAQQS